MMVTERVQELIKLLETLRWYITRFGERADIEAQDRDSNAFEAAWDAMTPEQQQAALEVEGLADIADRGAEDMFASVAARLGVRVRVIRKERDALAAEIAALRACSKRWSLALIDVSGLHPGAAAGGVAGSIYTLRQCADDIDAVPRAGSGDDK
jgi:hypothetical protein